MNEEDEDKYMYLVGHSGTESEFMSKEAIEKEVLEND